mgnify:CR=1 FL=1
MPETTIQEQIIRESPEFEAIKLGLLQSGQQLANVPIQLPLQQLADFAPLQQQAFAQAVGPQGIGAYLPSLTAGTAALETGLGTIGAALGPTEEARAAALGTAGLFAPGDLTAYTNPFQQAVIDETLKRLDEEGALAQNQLAEQATRAGSFGGGRFGLERGRVAEGLQDAKARALAQLNQQNYSQALQTAQQSFENQQTRQQQLAQSLLGIGSLTGQIGAQQAGIGGQQIGAGQAAQQAGLRDIAALQQLGGQQQQQQQSILEAQRANIQKQLYEPYSRVSWLSDLYKGAPSTQTSLGSLTAPTPPPASAFQQIAGAGTGLLGLGIANKQLGGLFG